MATATPVSRKKITGGSFLIEERNLEGVFTPEDFTEEHLQIAATTDEFALKEIAPAADKLEKKDWALTRELLKKASELGLTSVEIPETYGGMDMDKVSAAIVAEHIAKYGSFVVTFGGHSGIGSGMRCGEPAFNRRLHGRSRSAERLQGLVHDNVGDLLARQSLRECRRDCLEAGRALSRLLGLSTRTPLCGIELRAFDRLRALACQGQQEFHFRKTLSQDMICLD